MSKRGNLKDMKKAVLYKSIYTKMVEFLKFQRLHVVNPLNNLINHLLRGDHQHHPISKNLLGMVYGTGFTSSWHRLRMVSSFHVFNMPWPSTATDMTT